ncbi:hypothetical protein MTsPCn9_05540 [Croceitalea sp. MTPC9]|uniref:hypothetical protein n=1 Tax=unclassified Croceitalea TaxID=2632280 RepID=UPI002B3C4421|nr:hypothetical protein MTsPCn6_03170 [Croceitalea sp. MTPC6]GMN15618.1 hypothetical protein MTsPCn9_05540 [Croceitalea sp. MTPC9]
MKKLLPLILFLITSVVIQAQKKSELITKVAELEKTILALNDSVSVAKRQINASDSKAELFEKENTELRNANATLLQNLTSFSKISKQNTETVNNALTSLNQKEQELNLIRDTFLKNDSITIQLLTQTKQTMGAGAKVGITDGELLISNSLDSLFGSDTAIKLTEGGLAWAKKVGELIKANPDRSVIVEGLNITGEFEQSYNQATAVANGILKTEGIEPNKIKVLVKDGNFKEGVSVRIGPNHKAFYTMLKTEFK